MDRQNVTSKSYINQLKNINEKDLKFVERDLAFYEKVSLVFLLYGSDKVNAEWALQGLLVLARSPYEETNFLLNYTEKYKNWKESLIESLTIIKANKVLRKLGFDVKELRIDFLPHLPQLSSYVHPLLKALYIMCECLTTSKCGNIIVDMKNLNKNAKNLKFDESRYLEIYLLHWITNSIISIGNYPRSDADKNVVNLNALYQVLKLNDLDEVKEMLVSAVTHMNKDFKMTIKSGKQQLNSNENDSPLTAVNNNFDRKESLAVNYDECYLIRKECAGIILIINQRDFYRDSNPELKDLLSKKILPVRRGTDRDKIRLEDTFVSFGYKPFSKTNLTHTQMLNEIYDVVIRSEVFDSVIICILSHGVKGAVYGSNSIPVDIQRIQQILASDKLLGKPKLLIVQACQGENLQKAKEINNLEYDSPSSVPAFSDMLTATSTVPGFASVRHIENGTWFIQTLCKLIDTQGDRKHMLDILTSVIKEVSTKRGSENQCMVPQTSSTLSKSLFLPKRCL